MIIGSNTMVANGPAVVLDNNTLVYSNGLLEANGIQTFSLTAPPSAASTTGPSNGSFAVPGTGVGTGVVKQVNPTGFSQFSDLSLMQNSAPELGIFNFPLVGILIGVFVIHLM